MKHLTTSQAVAAMLIAAARRIADRQAEHDRTLIRAGDFLPFDLAHFADSRGAQYPIKAVSDVWVSFDPASEEVVFEGSSGKGAVLVIDLAGTSNVYVKIVSPRWGTSKCRIVAAQREEQKDGV